MKRLFRSVVAVVVCTLALMPAAWGRDNRMRMGHPDNDDTGFMIASTRSSSRNFFVLRIPISGSWFAWTIWIPDNQAALRTGGSVNASKTVRHGAGK